MISGGFADGGESSSTKKTYLCSIRSGETLEVQAVSKLPPLDTTITFSDSDMEGCQHPHDDPLATGNKGRRGQQNSSQDPDRQRKLSEHHIRVSI